MLTKMPRYIRSLHKPKYMSFLSKMINSWNNIMKSGIKSTVVSKMIP